MHFSEALLSSVFVLCAAMVEQVVWPRKVTTAWRVFATLWLLTVLIVTNAYRAMMQLNYILQPKYSTVYTRLIDLDKFTLYFTYETPASWPFCDTKFLLGDANKQSPADSFCAEHVFVSKCYTNDGRYPCRIHEEEQILKTRNNHSNPTHSKGYLQWREAYAKKIENMRRRYKIINLSSVKNRDIVKRLKFQRTALVTTLKYFKRDWERVTRASRYNDKVAFANNLGSDDTTLRSTLGYAIIGGCNKHHRRANILQQLRTLRSSGIHEAWQKWKIWKNSSRNGRSVTSVQAQQYIPLSLSNSDIHFVFQLYAIMISLPAWTLAVELAVKAKGN